MTTPATIQTAVIDSIRGLHDFHFNTLAAAEAHTEKWVRAVLDKTPWVDERVRKTADDWIAIARQNRLQFKGILDENIKTIEKLSAAV